VTDAPELTRRERRKREVHGRILAAAVGLFDQRGFGATKVAEICERADVAHKTFFNHFPSKLHLLRAVAGDAVEQLLVEIEEARKRPGSTRERLLQFFGRVADNADEAGPMHRELLTEMVHVASEAGTGSEQARRLHDAFGALIREGRVAGDVSAAHPLHTQTEMVLGAFYALMFNWAHLEGYPLRRQALAAASFLGDALCLPSERTTP
jgi:AcrR family transcriptional regulator